MLDLANSHFSKFSVTPLSSRRRKTALTLASCSSDDSPKIMMSSIMHSTPGRSSRTLCILFWKCSGAMFDCAMFLYYFSKNSFLMKYSGKNEIPIFFENTIFFRKSTKFSVPTFSIYYFFEKIRNLVSALCTFTTFRHFCVRNVNIAKCHFLSFRFIIYAARDIRSIPDTMWRYYRLSNALN